MMNQFGGALGSLNTEEILEESEKRFINERGDTMNGDLDFNLSNTVTNIRNPVKALDVVNKQYVDANISVQNETISNLTKIVKDFSEKIETQIKNNETIIKNNSAMIGRLFNLYTKLGDDFLSTKEDFNKNFLDIYDSFTNIDKYINKKLGQNKNKNIDIKLEKPNMKLEKPNMKLEKPNIIPMRLEKTCEKTLVDGKLVDEKCKTEDGIYRLGDGSVCVKNNYGSKCFKFENGKLNVIDMLT